MFINNRSKYAPQLRRSDIVFARVTDQHTFRSYRAVQPARLRNYKHSGSYGAKRAVDDLGIIDQTNVLAA